MSAKQKETERSAVHDHMLYDILEEEVMRRSLLSRKRQVWLAIRDISILIFALLFFIYMQKRVERAQAASEASLQRSETGLQQIKNNLNTIETEMDKMGVK